MHQIPKRIAKFISPEPLTGCWFWTGGLMGKGYGKVHLRGRRFYAHRVIYEFIKGPIPSGLTIDHRCGVHSCVNPDHLEPVSLVENIQRYYRGILSQPSKY